MKYLMFEANGAVNNAKTVSPAIDLTNASEDIEMSFLMYAFGADMGTLNVGVSNSQSGPFNNVFTWAGQYQTNDSEPWVPVGVNLSTYIGQTIYIEFDYTALPETSDNNGDMAIDFLRIESCIDASLCLPGFVGFENVTTSTADMNWVPGVSETNWEYVLQPNGTGVPTGSGTPSSLSLINLVDLTDDTLYEVYVRSECAGGGFSEWGGPYVFLTEILYDRIIECGEDEYSTIYCYGAVDNGDVPIEFSYTSSDGSPLIIFFNSGELGLSSFSGNDNLVVKDGNGNVLYNGIGLNNDGDLSGLFFQSNQVSPASNELIFYIDATSLGGCIEDGFEPIDITVSCLSCDNIPEANYTYDVVPDCNSNPEYYINVNLTSLGDASSVLISDNLAIASETVTTNGVVQVGPYPFNTDVQITIADVESALCFTRSQKFNINSCPPVNDDCFNAIELEVNSSGSCAIDHNGTLLEATPSESSMPDPSCNANGGNDDVWYKFIAQETVQRIEINGLSSWEYLDNTLYEGEDCNDLTEIYCYKNFDDYAINSTIITPQLIIGSTYYIRVYSQGQINTDFDFSICIQNAPEAIPMLCNNAETLCLDDTGAFETVSHYGAINHLHPQTNCLEWMPNPTWVEFEVEEAGPLEFNVSQFNDGPDGGCTYFDMDIAVFGPFTSLDDVCADIYNLSPIDCGNGNTNSENITIPNAQVGDKYIILGINISSCAHYVTITQTNFNEDGAGIVKNRLHDPVDIEPSPICDQGNNGVENVDLSVYDFEISGGNTGLFVSYYLTQEDADLGMSAISSIEIEVNNPKIIYANLGFASDSGCGCK